MISWKPVLLITLCTLFTTLGQYLQKVGLNTFQPTLPHILTNYALIAGFLLYVIAALLLILGLREGELSTLFPILSTSYIWVALLSFFFLNELITLKQWIGISSILIGVIVIHSGGKT